MMRIKKANRSFKRDPAGTKLTTNPSISPTATNDECSRDVDDAAVHRRYKGLETRHDTQQGPICGNAMA
jgi:transaldolase